eukprot:8714749-Ditylum_brightwellii.AAC.1
MASLISNFFLMPTCDILPFSPWLSGVNNPSAAGAMFAMWRIFPIVFWYARSGTLCFPRRDAISEAKYNL